MKRQYIETVNEIYKANLEKFKESGIVTLQTVVKASEATAEELKNIQTKTQ